MSSDEIKRILKERRVYQWEIAKRLGVTEFTLTRWLREDLSDEKKEQVLKALDEVLEQRRSIQGGLL